MDIKHCTNGKDNYNDKYYNYKDIPIKYLNKKYYYIKENVEEKEATLQTLVCNIKNKYLNIPRIYFYDKVNKLLVMRRIPNMNLSDQYGENYDDIPPNIREKIYNAISTLYYNNIDYQDITGYNFIYYSNKIWVLDFEHAKYDNYMYKKPSFMKDFVHGKVKKWNSYFQ